MLRPSGLDEFPSGNFIFCKRKSMEKTSKRRRDTFSLKIESTAALINFFCRLRKADLMKWNSRKSETQTETFPYHWSCKVKLGSGSCMDQVTNAIRKGTWENFLWTRNFRNLDVWWTSICRALKIFSSDKLFQGWLTQTFSMSTFGPRNEAWKRHSK